ncbi:MAG: tetratricopeptide repeat protein [Candidatus Kariarchaeaceae archaeon]
MSREEPAETSEPVNEPLDQVEQLINQLKIDEALGIIEGREKEDGIKELRWRIEESRCRNVMEEYEQVIEITDEIIEEISKEDETVEQKGEQTRIRIDALNSQIWALRKLERQEEGLEKVEEGIRLIEELKQLKDEEKQEKDKEREVKLLSNIGLIHIKKNESDQALGYFEKRLIICKELRDKQLISGSLYFLGVAYLQKNELNRAIEYYKKSLALLNELGDKRYLAAPLTNLGVIYSRKGELDQALEYYKKSLVITEESGHKESIAILLNNIGRISQRKGELSKALEYYEKSLEIRKGLGNKQLTTSSMISIGEINQELGELDVALELFKQSLAMRREDDNVVSMGYVLFCLIRVTIDLGNINQARNYLGVLQQKNEKKENKKVDLWSRLAEALVLKTSKRRKKLARAEDILEEIVNESNEEVISHELTVQALVNLSELLLEELRLTGEEEVLQELEEKVGKLFDIAREQQSYSLLAESYWLKAQLALVRLDLKEARNLLSDAQVIAEDKGLVKLARKISSEHDNLLQQLDQWEELIAEDASIAERVKIANLEELVGWMARKREIKIEEPEDKPVMLLLVSDGGLPLYCNKFNQTKELQEMLISAFLTSINHFVQEAFEFRGMIRRIMLDKYTLSFNLVEPILFCYVYEGQSYTAMKKLEKLMAEVRESELWSALEKVSKTGCDISEEESAQMEGMIEEIFVTN